MDNSNAPPFDTEAMVSLLSSVLAELNIGLFIYYLEDPETPGSLRLVYANRAASEYTKTDLSGRIGKRIGEAFPGLAGTDLPGLFADVVRKKQPRNIGAFEYEGDAEMGRGHYAVKAFPMPNDCVGIVFENITARKQLEELVKRRLNPDGNR